MWATLESNSNRIIQRHYINKRKPNNTINFQNLHPSTNLPLYQQFEMGTHNAESTQTQSIKNLRIGWWRGGSDDDHEMLELPELERIGGRSQQLSWSFRCSERHRRHVHSVPSGDSRRRLQRRRRHFWPTERTVGGS